MSETLTIRQLIDALNARVAAGDNDLDDNVVIVDPETGDKTPIWNVSGDDEAWIETGEWDDD